MRIMTTRNRLNLKPIMKRTTVLWLALWSLLALSLGACATQQPILVYITPTPDVPTSTPTPIVTLGAPPSSTPSSPDQPTSTPMVLGPVVGVNFTQQITATETAEAAEAIAQRATRTQQPPAATATPTLTATVTPTFTATATNTPAPSPTPEATLTPVPKLNRDLMGVQVYAHQGTAEWDFFLSRVQELGVSWIKVQANWAFLQPNGPNADEQALRTFELNMQAADRVGLKVLLSIAKAPPWARPNGQADSPPDDPQALADFLRLMFTQTKIGEVIDGVEIWNEPNLRREWNTNFLPFNGAGYMRLFAPAYDAIRAYRGDLVIVTAGLAPTATIGDLSVDDRLYLQQMYDAGLRRYQDIVIGVHPYSWGNAPDARCCDPSPERGWDDNPRFFFFDNIEATREIMNRNGHNNVQMWATEFGWAVWQDLSVGLPDPAENNLWMTYNTLDDQTNYTLRAFEIGQQRGDIGVMFLWNLNFANELTIENRQEIVGYSLLFPPDEEGGDIRRRPLAYVLPFAASP
jgi:aryl-phospho-beta-D-glucosidase BglC (GH1 family)